MANTKTTQEYVEVLSSGPSSERVTQEYVETLSSIEDPHERVTQEYVEVLSEAGTPQVRVTQEYAEVLSFQDQQPIDILSAARTRTLGCGEYKVLLTERGGGHHIDFLPFNNLTYGRVVDEVSSATISVPTGGATALADCCAAFTRSDSFDGIVDCWSHEITIIRDDEPVWVGPITGMHFGFNTVSIECRDLFAWFDKRLMPYSRNEIGDLAALFESLAHDALDLEPSPNITIFSYAANLLQQVKVLKQDYVLAGNLLRQIGKDGIDFTMIGRTLYEGDFDRLATYLGSDLRISQQAIKDATLERRGTEMATQFTLTGRPPGGSNATIAATEGGIDPKYGLVQVQQAESFITVPAFLHHAAKSRQALIKTPPRYLDVTLDPRAPFELNELICGFLVDVRCEIGCATVSEVMRLHAMNASVNVSDKGELSEDISITLVPRGLPGLGLGFDLGF